MLSHPVLCAAALSDRIQSRKQGQRPFAAVLEQLGRGVGRVAGVVRVFVSSLNFIPH